MGIKGKYGRNIVGLESGSKNKIIISKEMKMNMTIERVLQILDQTAT